MTPRPIDPRIDPLPCVERQQAEARRVQGVDAGGVTLHECRHTFASLLIHAGVNAKAIQTFMGHATIQMTFDQYGHLMPGSREEARELDDAYLDAAVREARIEATACASDAPGVSVGQRLAAAETDGQEASTPHS